MNEFVHFFISLDPFMLPPLSFRCLKVKPTTPISTSGMECSINIKFTIHQKNCNTTKITRAVAGDGTNDN